MEEYADSECAFSLDRYDSRPHPRPSQPKSDNANSVFWGGAMIWLPWRHFLHYGDYRVLKQFYPNMVAYADCECQWWECRLAHLPVGLNVKPRPVK